MALEHIAALMPRVLANLKGTHTMKTIAASTSAQNATVIELATRVLLMHETDASIRQNDAARAILCALIEPEDVESTEPVGGVMLDACESEQDDINLLIEAARDRIQPSVVARIRARLARREAVASATFESTLANYKDEEADGQEPTELGTAGNELPAAVVATLAKATEAATRAVGEGLVVSVIRKSDRRYPEFARLNGSTIVDMVAGEERIHAVGSEELAAAE